MYGLKPVPFKGTSSHADFKSPYPSKDGALLFLELLSTEFAVISVHQQGVEITVTGVWPIQDKQIVGLRPSYSTHWVHNGQRKLNKAGGQRKEITCAFQRS
jgi:hypothetical protein